MRRLITERFLVCTWGDAVRSSIGGEIDVQEEVELEEAELRRDDELGAAVLFGMCVVPEPLAEAFERVYALDEWRDGAIKSTGTSKSMVVPLGSRWGHSWVGTSYIVRATLDLREVLS
jgi:hypothetical protein